MNVHCFFNSIELGGEEYHNLPLQSNLNWGVVAGKRRLIMVQKCLEKKVPVNLNNNMCVQEFGAKIVFT